MPRATAEPYPTSTTKSARSFSTGSASWRRKPRMIETADMQSVFTRAKRLTGLSRAKSENAKETQEQGQAETALHNLKAELAKLDNGLAAYRKLREAGAP